jgi:hypothetical protein
MKSQLRGIFMTSEDPERTVRFYREVARLDLEQIGDPSACVYWKLDRDGVQLAIHDARQIADYAHPALRESNLTHLYFKIDDQRQFLAHLGTFGIEPYATDDVVVTVEDPDGRKVMFGTA